MSEPIVTIVVVPRERFSYTKESLESIYDNTQFPFNLVYVDGNSPRHIKQYLENKSKEKDFKLIRTDYFVSPNQARNLALKYVKTRYVIFIDNDVLVARDWLEKLVNCAEETDAWMVGPLCLEGPNFDTIHQVTGTFKFKEKNNQRWLVEKRPYMRLPLSKVQDKLKRETTQIVEFHCMLARTELFEQIGLLDEKFMTLAQETDICLTLFNMNKPVYFEPDSIVSYVPPKTLSLSDLPYFFFRWSNTWGKISLEHLQEKWNLTPESPTIRHYQQFLRGHRFLICPKRQLSLNYITKRIMVAVLTIIMDWKATQSLPLYLEKKA
ncbi:glycosyltransferase family 2 protein [Crocosphaera sp.]|uniref:glycosyltransferase family 2 protein n=1 Tax=Crocosphaera sp. TaxID=2729996 RepID=UPI003F2345EE|nr:glycosyltransferase [Crocosphaera sp.]